MDYGQRHFSQPSTVGHVFDPSAYQAHQHQHYRQDDASSIDSIQQELRDRELPQDNGITTDAPDERFRLGYVDVVCLILNRMIGSGIFNTPQKVMSGTQSSGASLLFWFFGVVYAMAGMHVYLEFGLNVPRIVYGGKEQSVPRSGGDLNYLQYVYRWIGYRGQTVLFITCLFGIAFIALGNMAGNCVNFAIWITRASGEQGSEAAIRGIAIAIATFSCFIHAFSRRGGIWLNDFLAIIKVMILLLIIVTAIIVAAAGKKVFGTEGIFSDNMNAGVAFKDASTDAHGYATAFLAIIFAYSGFEQPNYVLGEIGYPRKRFPISMIVGTSLVCLIYMATNMAYMVVVPACAQKMAPSQTSVAEQFFNLTFSGYTIDSPTSCVLKPPASPDTTGYQIFSAFVAISSFGNIVVMTFTAARVKQEIAKQGILPFAKFFAHNSDFSIGRLLKWFQNKGYFHSVFRYKWFSPEEHSEKTPVGALLLHWVSCLILLLATIGLKASDVYTLLSSLAAYVVNAFFGVLLGLGILILRVGGPPSTSPETKGKTWTEMTGSSIKTFISVTCAIIYTVGNAWPVVNMWISPAAKADSSSLAWFVIPTVSWCILGTGAAWFLGFFAYAKRREKKAYEVFTVEKSAEYEHANATDGDNEASDDGGLILVHETVYLAWQAKEIMEKEETEMRSL